MLDELIDMIPQVMSFLSGAISDSQAIPDELIVFRTDHLKMSNPVNIHNRFMIFIVREGEVSVAIDHLIHRIKAGCGIVLFPYQAHMFHEFHSSQIRVVHISFELQDAVGIAGLRNVVFQIDDEAWGVVGKIIENYIVFRNGSDSAGAEACLYAAILLVRLSGARLLDIDVERRIRADNELMLKITRYVNERYAESIHLLDVAKHVSMSVSHLRRVFKRQAKGLTLGNLIRRIQLYNAARLLSSTDLNVSEVAEKCGFSSVYAFSRAFKNHFNNSPSKVREATRERYHR